MNTKCWGFLYFPAISTPCHEGRPASLDHCSSWLCHGSGNLSGFHCLTKERGAWTGCGVANCGSVKRRQASCHCLDCAINCDGSDLCGCSITSFKKRNIVETYPVIIFYESQRPYVSYSGWLGIAISVPLLSFFCKLKEVNRMGGGGGERVPGGRGGVCV